MQLPDTELIAEHITLVHVVVALLAGLQAGGIYAYANHLGTRMFHSVVMSSMFFLPLLFTTMATQERPWSVWLALWGLWTVFSLGNVAGYRLRTWYEIRRRLNKR
jgi:hypothetical protein